MFAGRDTVRLGAMELKLHIDAHLQTTGSLTLVFYFLSMYPEILGRLREEIMEQVGPTRMPTYDDVKDLKYLRAVINGPLLKHCTLLIHILMLCY